MDIEEKENFKWLDDQFRKSYIWPIGIPETWEIDGGGRGGEIMKEIKWYIKIPGTEG